MENSVIDIMTEVAVVLKNSVASEISTTIAVRDLRALRENRILLRR